MPGNFASGTQGITASSELNRLAAGLQGTYGWAVQSGAVTFNAGLIFNVAAIAASDYTVNSVSGAVYAGGTVTLNAQDPTNPRVDIIVITSAGAVSAVAGTPAALTTVAGPVPPTPSTTQLEIARIYVPATGTALSAASITDRRHPLLSVPGVFDGIRTLFRANRRLVAEFAAQEADDAGATVAGNVGIGFQIYGAGGGGTFTTISGEPTLTLSVGLGANGVVSAAANVLTAALSPAHSPRMLVRFAPPAASANVTDFLVGFFSANSATPNGAYIRIVTTGHLFFVTHQGGTETTFDMGAQVAGTVVGYEIESVDAGVTWVLRNQAGTVLATQTTNVPTAATALSYGLAATEATGAIAWSAAYCRVEGTFA